MGKASNRKKNRRQTPAKRNDLSAPQQQYATQAQREQWMRSVYQQATGMVGAKWQERKEPATIPQIMVQLYKGVDQCLAGVKSDLDSIRERGHAEAKVDCKAGCNYCCHMEVSAGAPEVIGVVAFVETRFTDEQRDALRKRLTTRNAESRTMTETEKELGSRPCPFLVGGQCSIYPVRPFTCRFHHSADVEACRREYEGEVVKIPLIGEFGEVTYPFVAGHTKALSDAGLKVEPLWFSEAMEIALYQPGAVEEWCSGGDPFAPTSKLAYEQGLARRPPPTIRVIG